MRRYKFDDEDETAVDYPIRTAEIGKLCIIDVSLSAIVQLGDRGEATPHLFGLAVQREVSHCKGGEFYFESYSIFNRPLPALVDPAFDNDDVLRIHRTNHCPRISVGCISITAVGAASILQAGNAMRTTSESRIMNIRQFKHALPTPGIGS